jgi:RHS repeat-associated protein
MSAVQVRLRWLVPLVATAVVVSMLSAPEFVAAAPGAPGSGGEKSVPVRPSLARPASPSSMDDPRYHPARRATWPAGGVAEFAVDTARAGATRASVAAGRPGSGTPGGLPVRVSAPGDAPTVSADPRTAGGLRRASGGPAPSRVRVEVAEPRVAERAGVTGVVFTVSRADGGTDPATVALDLDYRAFADMYGGNFGQRLTLVQLPACVLTTPQLTRCQVRTPVRGATNIETAGVVSAPVVPVAGRAPSRAAGSAKSTGTVYALVSVASSGAGTYNATSFNPSYEWTAGTQSGDFNWTYPMKVPASPGGLDPEVALSYSSQSVDGLTTSTNNQASWVGRGWDWNPGYIERSFNSCSDDGGHATGDMCWNESDKIFHMVLGSESKTIVWSQWDGSFRMGDGDGWKIEFEGLGTVNGMIKTYWRITSTDGTVYKFGRWQRYTDEPVDSGSALLMPVFGDDPGEMCHAATYAASYCYQVYRWYLDDVIDPRGNSMRYYYSRFQGKYGRNNNQAAAPYDMVATLDHIDYGMRVGQELSAPAPMRVDNLWFNRTDDNNLWQDVPWDQYCEMDKTTCPNETSPIFFTPFRLNSVLTQVYDPTISDYRTVDRWDLDYDFPDAGGGSGPTLYLREITHTGYAANGTTSLVEPPMRFEAIALANRVDWGNGTDVLSQWRMETVKTGTGREVFVAYHSADCTKAMVTGGQIDPDQNNKRCFPQYTSVGGWTGWAYFHKYVVGAIVDTDLIGDVEEKYDYTYTMDGSSANVTWMHDKNDVTPIARRSWSMWAGYPSVYIYHGEGASQQVTKRRYYRGMHNDRTDAGDNTRNVTAYSSQGSFPDSGGFIGRLIEETSYTATDVVAASTIHSYSELLVGVWDAPWPNGDRGMVIVRPDQTRTRRLLANGTWRWTQTDTDTDGYGRTTQVKDLGDEATTADDVCSVTSYAENTGTHLLDRVSESKTRAGTACTSGTLLGETQTFYDGSNTLGAAPTAGLATKTRTHVSMAPDPDHWATTQTTYDVYGRALSVIDARNQTTTTAFTPATGGPATQVTVTNPLNHVITTTLDRRGHPTQIVDPNNKTTTLAYDALGRLTDVWLPGHPSVSTQDLQYTYATSNTANSITTKRLGPNGNQITSYEMFDGRFRSRQIQQPAPQAVGGRIVTDTIYNGRGEVAKRSSLYNANAPAATLVTFNDVDIKTQNRYTYDLLGRVTTDQFWSQNVFKWQTSTVYTGEQTKVTPPAGGIATTTIVDAEGRTSALRQHLNGLTTGPYQTTSYGYDLLGRLTQVTDPAANQWTTTYDLGGRAKTTSDPDKGVTQMIYTAAGDRASVTDARGITLAYAYDAVGRRTELWQGAVGTGTKRAQWYFDSVSGGATSKGQLIKATRWHDNEAYSTETTSFDDAYRPLSTSVTMPASMGTLTGPWTSTATYKPDGSVATKGLPAAGSLSAETITFTYDNSGHSLTMAGTDTYISNTSYTGRGQVNKLWLGTGSKRVQLEKVVDAATSRLTENRVSTENQTTPNTWVPQLIEQYGYDDAGNVKNIKEVTGAGATVSNQCFTHDGLRRLTEAWTTTAGTCQATPSQAVVGGPDPYWASYQFNSIGNRTLETIHQGTGDTTRTYTYPASGATSTRPHAVSTVVAAGASTGTDTYGYDNAGNTTTRNITGKPGQTLTWDPEDHLATVTDSGGTTSYLYTADGQRLIANEPGSVTTVYLGDYELRRTITGTTGTRHYGVATRTTGGGLTWLAADHHDTGQVAVNPTSLAVTRRKTDPYGNPRGAAVTWPTTRGFVNGTADSTGLTHLGARAYEPGTGRFISVDPVMDLTEPGQWNGYAYSNSNPVTLSDPSGLDPCLSGGGGCYHDGKDPEHKTKPPIKPIGGGCGGAITDNVAERCAAQAKADRERALNEDLKKKLDDMVKKHPLINTSTPKILMGICHQTFGVAKCGDVGAYQIAWCYEYGAAACATVFELSVKAQFDALIFEWDLRMLGVPKKEAIRRANAYRHALWMARLVLSGFSAEQALSFGVAHELDNPNPAHRYGHKNSDVDLRNNVAGVNIGLNYEPPERRRIPHRSQAHVTSPLEREIKRAADPMACTSTCLDVTGF